jgi:hypothetical protein
MRLSKRTSLTAALVTLVLPATAAADDYCVARSGCATANSYPAGGLQDALNAARDHPNAGGPDRVLIGAGTFAATGLEGFTYYGDPVHIVGAGSGTDGTRFVAADPGARDDRLLSILGPEGHEIEALSARLPASAGNVAIATRGAVANVKLSAPGSATGGGGILGVGSLQVDNAEIEMPTAMTEGSGWFLTPSYAIAANSGDELVVRDATLAAHWAITSGATHTVVQRVRATGYFGLAVTSRTASVDSSLIRVLGSGAGVYAGSPGENSYTHVRGATIVGSDPESIGVHVAGGASSAHNSGASVTSTVIRDVGHPFAATTSRADTDAAIYAEYNDLLPAGNLTSGRGSESILLAAGNRTSGGDAGFMATVGPDAYKLRPDSGLIDAGAPYPFGAMESTADVARLERAVDGDGDGSARRDIGAFEYQPASPEPPTGGGDPAPPVNAPAPDAPTNPGPGSPAAPSGPPAAPAAPGITFRLGAVRQRPKGFDLTVEVTNTTAGSLTFAAGATERDPAGRKPRTRRYATRRTRIAAGARRTVVLKVPKVLAAKLQRQIALKGRVTRRPTIRVTDVAAARSVVVTPKVVSRGRKAR